MGERRGAGGRRVIAACVSLDPPDRRAPVRASDGRSIWLAPSEPHLTHERVLAEEERILTFAIEAYDRPAQPSTTLHRHGLDVLQAGAAAAVAGHDPLVLVVGPAGTGKTTTLSRSVEDLRRQRRTVFGVAPAAKAAKVLRDETGMPADTVAKLLYEWRHGQPHNGYRLPPGTTVVVDEAGMCGTGALDRLVLLTMSQHWRLVLVGDPRQLQAVGRGGMFDELCRTGRVHELATIHRFRHQWEHGASPLLRAGNPEALDAYFAHRRVSAGTFDALVVDAARLWVDHADRGRTVALVAGPRAVGELAELLPVSRPAVSQHLKLLKAARLVESRAEGTKRIYRADPNGLEELRRQLDGFWDQTLANFKQLVEQPQEDG